MSLTIAIHLLYDIIYFLYLQIKNKIMKKVAYLFVAFTLIISTISCKQGKKATSNKEKKIGVLLVNHGSHSKNWRNSLLDLEKNVRPVLEKNKNIKGIKTAFMEYNEPSIATRLKEFDEAGFTDVILVHVLRNLTRQVLPMLF